MSTHHDIDFFKDKTAAREWQAQEAAMHAARADHAPADARDAAYRRIDQVARIDSIAGLPAHFAESLAAKAGPAPTSATVPERGIEKYLTHVLLAALLIAGLGVALLKGDTWFHADPTVWSVAGNPWLLALLACLGVSQGAELLRRKLG